MSRGSASIESAAKPLVIAITAPRLLAGGDAEDLGARHGIAEQALHDDAAYREGGAGEQGHQNAGQPEKDDDRDVLRARGGKGVKSELAEEKSDEGDGCHGDRPDSRRDKHRDNEGGDEKGEYEGLFLLHRDADTMSGPAPAVNGRRKPFIRRRQARACAASANRVQKSTWTV